MRNWLKTVLFVSAFSPVLISIAGARYWEKGYSPDVAYYTLAGVAGVCLCLAVVAAIRRYGEVINFTAKKIESNDALMLGVLLSYVAPFLGKASEVTVGIVLCLFALGAVVLWMTNALLPHPLLRLLKYRFYKVESERGMVYTLISRRELIDPKNITRVRRISSSMLMEA